MAKFKDLKVGQHFQFPGERRSFHNVAKKTSTRCYVWAARQYPSGGSSGRVCMLKSRVGTTSVTVVAGRQRSTRVRRGRKRG